jgi:dTDP-4-dehydrorhamnose reductase
MYGIKTPTSQSFIQPFIKTLKDGKKLKLFSDEYRPPVSGFSAAKGLLLSLEKQVNGIIHLGGKQRLSSYEFGQILAEILEISPELIKSCSQQDVKMSAPRPQDVSLDSTKAFNLGYNPEYIQTELMSLKEQL